MKKYDYRKEMIKDIKQYMQDNPDLVDPNQERFLLVESWNDALWDVDEITGNGPNFYDTEEKCEEYVVSNLSLYFDAANDFDNFPNHYTHWVYKNPAQHMDTLIRCYLLWECIAQALEDLEHDTNK